MASSDRARTADREAAVELINTAFVDGQLSAVERDDKVSSALVARTMGHLERATAGLQRPGPATPPAVAPTGGVRGWWSGRSRAARIGIAAVLAVALCAGAVAMFDQPDDQPRVRQTERRPVSVSAETVGELLTDYASKFETTQSYGVIAMRDWTRVWVPTEDGRARYQEWTLIAEGAFEQTDTRGADDLQRFDLVDVDLDALAVTIEEARSELGVEGPNRTDVAIEHRGSTKKPEITVNVVNKYKESGYLITNLGGRVLTREPYDTP